MNAFPVLFASWQLNCSGHESFANSRLSRCHFLLSLLSAFLTFGESQGADKLCTCHANYC